MKPLHSSVLLVLLRLRLPFHLFGNCLSPCNVPGNREGELHRRAETGGTFRLGEFVDWGLLKIWVLGLGSGVWILGFGFGGFGYLSLGSRA